MNPKNPQHSGILGFLSIVLMCVISINVVDAQRMWINEFHYDNVGADVGEFIEVVMELGVDPNEITIQRYEGTDGTTESPVLNVGSDFIPGDTIDCFTFWQVLQVLENDSEGIALSYQGVNVEFISYEGSFIATEGLAAGRQSEDIMVTESNTTTPVGHSLQRVGSGTNAADFTWGGPGAESPGSPNTMQDFSDPSLSATLIDAPESGEPAAVGDTIKYTITIDNSGDGDAKGTSLDRMIPLDPNTTLVPTSFKSTPIAYDSYVINVPEDAVNYMISLQGFDPDGDLLTYSITSPTKHGSLGSVAPAVPTAGSATVPYSPDPDYFGPDTLEFSVLDDDGNACPAIIIIQVQPINNPPTITCGPDQVVINTAGAQTVLSWATNISVGPPNESFQNPPTITVSNTNGTSGLFSVQPDIDEGTGDLTYTPDPNSAGGVANLTVTISDGITFIQCMFMITVQDPPDAIDDALTTMADMDLSEDLFVDNGSGADDLGFPVATITSFGGGSLGGTVTSNTAGTTINSSGIGGGNLTVNANGSMTLSGQPFAEGTYTFLYRLTNAAGSDDATVTIMITPPDLAPTVFSHTPANNSLDAAVNTNVTVTFSESVNAAVNAFTLVGANSGAHTFVLSGGPIMFTLNPNVDFDPFEDVTLTVVAANVTDQDAIDPPDNMAMDFTCVFKTIGLPPVCVHDGPAANSVPTDDFHTALNTTLNAVDGTSEDLLTNDNLGAPTAVLTEFGPTVAVGTVAGMLGSSKSGSNNLTVNTNGSFNYTPPMDFVGMDSFYYELENQYATVVCSVAIAVGVRPICGTKDTYTATGNIQITINAASGVLSNDMGDGLSLVINTTSANGTLVLAADGSFTYDPNAGYTGTDAFTYDITNGFGTATCDAEVVVSQMIWFVDINGTGSNTGTFNDPFKSLAAFNAVNNGTGSNPATGDFISLATGTYNETDGINLLNDQTLIGEGVQLDLHFTADANSIATYGTFAGSAGPRPTINAMAGNAIDVGTGNTIRGLNLGSTPNANWGISGSTIGTLTISDMMISGTGGTMNLTGGGTLAATLDKVASTGSSGTAAINLNSIGGSLTISNGGGIDTDITGASAGISIQSAVGGASFSFAETSISTSSTGLNIQASANTTTSFDDLDITHTGGTGILVDAGGTLNVADGSINSGANSALNIQNTTTTVGFNLVSISVINSALVGVRLQSNTGVWNLGDVDITTASAATGFFASNAGTVNSTAGTINTGAGRAIDIDNTTLGLDFTSISSSGGSLPGIDLNTTTGHFIVDGDGANTMQGGNASGGTIANKTGVNGAGGTLCNFSATVGLGILLIDADSVVLRRMQLNDFSNYGIFGRQVDVFNFEYSTVNGTNGDLVSDREGSIAFCDLRMKSLFQSVDIEGALEDNLSIENSTGTTLDSLIVENSRIGLNSTTSGNDGILVETRNTAILKMRVSDNMFVGARGDLLQANAIGTSNLSALIRDNTFANAHTNSLGGGITISGGSASSNITVNYEISGSTPGSQTFRDAVGSAITCNFVSGTGTINGKIQNNAIGVSGIDGSGSEQGNGISTGAAQNQAHTVLVHNNVIQEVKGFAGIETIANVDVVFNGTITNNIVTLSAGMTNNFALAAGYFLFGGVGTETGTSCLDIRGNTFNNNGAPFSGNAVFIDQISALGNHNFPGYVPGAMGANGEFAFACAAGTASAGLSTFLGTTNVNTLTNGPFPSFPGIGVDASIVCGVTGSGTSCP